MDKDLNSIYLDRFVAIDVETTGLDFKTDEIIEVSAVKYEFGKVVDSFTKLVNPNKLISPFITNLTGIKNSDVVNEKFFLDIASDFVSFIDNLPLVGHNIDFDLKFLHNSFNNTYNIFDHNYICDTYLLSKIFYYSSNSFKLESLCNDFNIATGNSHRAEDDAKSSGDLFLKLLDRVFMCDLNTINDIYKCYKDTMYINKNLFFHLINYKIDINENNHKNISINNNYKSNSFEYKSKSNKKLNFEEIYIENGILDSKITNYEFRASQYEFSKNVMKSFDNNSIFVAEAETGLGKSYGYLVPVMLNSYDNKILLSTSTHNLQEQLFHKDIPSLSKALDVSIKACLVKGMKNYICVKRFKGIMENLDALNDSDIYELLSLMIWIENTKTGDISECNSFQIDRLFHLWDLINYDYQFCSFHKSDYSKCFYNKLKEEVQKSNLLVINHSLLATIYNKEESLFEDFNLCVIDEGHKITENCRMHLKEFISSKYMNGLYNSTITLIDKILSQNYESESYSNLGNFKTKIELEFQNFIESYREITNDFADDLLVSKLKFNGKHDIRFKLSEENKVDFSCFLEKFLVFKNNLELFYNLIEKNDSITLSRIQKLDMSIIKSRFEELDNSLNNIFMSSKNQIKWISAYINNNKISLFSFNSVPLQIEEVFGFFYKKFSSIILTSATLTVDDSFDFILNEIGINSLFSEKSFKTKRFLSPFFLKDQTKLFINSSNENIDSDGYNLELKNMILDIRRKVSKRTLVLCTSYKQILNFKNMLSNFENIYFQDKTTSKEILLKNYLSNKNSILFGTASFWEGIDLPNDKLEILVILKVPFSNPYNPIVEAKIEQFREKNMDPFINYQLSEAILKLKQGFGRLIRHQNDTGVCIIADTRILNKSYGQIILDSLPADYTRYNSSDYVVNEIDKFLG